jgi:peptide/nickel transport system permease protein
MSCYTAFSVREITRRARAPWGRAILATLALLLILPSLLPLEPYGVDLEAILQPPSRAHWLGTDENGRDALARLLAGARVTLGIAAGATLVALAIGGLVGGVAGYAGGILDSALMRFVDLGLAFPSLFAILLCAALFVPGPGQLVLLIGATSWMTVARLVRGGVQELLHETHTEAARSLGASAWRLLWRHLLPNLVGLLFVAGLVQLSRSILAEATVSFLGFGIQPPTPTWGSMLIGAQGYVFTAPWLALGPGLAITATLVAISSLGIGGPPTRLLGRAGLDVGRLRVSSGGAGASPTRPHSHHHHPSEEPHGVGP